MLHRELPPGTGLMLLTGIGFEKRAEAGDEKYAEPSVFSRWALREWGSNYRMNANPETSWLEDGQKRGFFKFASDGDQPGKRRKDGLRQAIQTGALTGGLFGAEGALRGAKEVREFIAREPEKYEQLISRFSASSANPVKARRYAMLGAKLSGPMMRGVPATLGGFAGGAAASLLFRKLRQRKQTGEVK